MIKTCPFKSTSNYANIDCSDKCVMYDNGCLIQQAIKLYIKNNTLFEMKQPTEEELDRLTELLKETLSKHPPEPILFRHPDLNIKHDYDNYVDWYPHGPNDIAP